jgi:hypothetical protein
MGAGELNFHSQPTYKVQTGNLETARVGCTNAQLHWSALFSKRGANDGVVVAQTSVNLEFIQSIPPAMKRTIVVLASIVLLSSPRKVTATIIAYEGFNYPDGSDIVGQNGGTGWANEWNTNAPNSAGGSSFVLAGSLAYTDSLGNALTTSGGKCLNSGTNGASQPGRTLSQLVGTNVNGETTWMSLVGVRIGAKTGTAGPGGTPTFEGGANVTLWDDVTAAAAASGQRLGIGENTGAAADVWTISPQGASSQRKNTTNYVGDQAFLVVRIDHTNDVVNGFTNDNVYIWINPVLSSEPLLASATTNVIATDTTFDYSFNRIRLFARALNGSAAPAEWLLDEIRIGTTYADVAPYAPSLPMSHARWTAVSQAGGGISLTLTGTPNATYQVLTSPSLTAPNWSTNGSVTLNGTGVGNYTDNGTVTTNAQRYYRSYKP